MEKERQPSYENEVELIHEVVERKYELIDITGDEPVSTNSVSEDSNYLESGMDERDQEVKFPTPLLNRFNSWEFLDPENLSQLQTYLENLLVTDKKRPKEMIENMDVSVSLRVQEPHETSLPNVKSGEKAILMKGNCNNVVSEIASPRNTKPSILPSTKRNVILVPDSTCETVNIKNTPEQVYTIPNDSHLNCVEAVTNLISKDIQQEPIITSSTTNKNLENEGQQKRSKNHVPASLSKKTKHLKVRVGECPSGKLPRNSSTPLAKTASIRSKVAVSAASRQRSSSQAKRPRSLDRDSKIDKFAEGSKKLSIEEYRLRKGISLLDPRRKAVPLATKRHRVSSQTPKATYRGVPPIYPWNDLTVSQTITSTWPSFQNSAGADQVFSQAVATDTSAHYFPFQYSTVFAGPGSSQNPQYMAYPMGHPYTPAQMAMLGDNTRCLIQVPMVQPFSQEQMANHGHWSTQNPMSQPFTTAQMPISSDPHAALQHPMDQ